MFFPVGRDPIALIRQVIFSLHNNCDGSHINSFAFASFIPCPTRYTAKLISNLLFDKVFYFIFLRKITLIDGYLNQV